MFELRNNANETISTHTTSDKARKAADKRTNQLSGARHSVWLNGFKVYETSPPNRATAEGLAR